LKKLWQPFLLTTVAMMPLAGVARCDEFYGARLKSGEAAYTERRLPDAIDNLKIASFGLLESPSLESEALVYLSLAQAAAGKNADADATLGRFLELERRFAPFSRLKLNPSVRADFQALLLQRVTPSSLLGFPGLAGLVETEEEKIAKLPPNERWKAYEAAARREPREPRWALDLAREAFALSDLKAAIGWSSRALELDPSSAEGHSLRAHALVLSGDCASAKADLQALSPADLEGRPTLVADRFVCLVELKDWTSAAEASKSIPSGQAGRPDVERARQKLATQRPSAH
jgi:hypothetical protein